MEKILIIDDEIYIRQILKYYLEKKYELTMVEDCFEAEDLIREGKEYDLIITDLVLPIRNGIEFIKLLRDEYGKKDQKILIMSAKHRDPDVEEAASYDVVDYVVKPFEAKDVVKKIEELLKKTF